MFQLTRRQLKFDTLCFFFLLGESFFFFCCLRNLAWRENRELLKRNNSAITVLYILIREKNLFGINFTPSATTFIIFDTHKQNEQGPNFKEAQPFSGQRW